MQLGKQERSSQLLSNQKKKNPKEFSYEEIEKIIELKEEERKHFMPNSIFNELKVLFPPPKDKEPKTNRGVHIAFSYSYYYLVSWLYRNAKYRECHINTPTIRQLLGYSRTNESMNFIIKRNGVLDKEKFTKTTNNYPVFWEFDEFGDPRFTLIKEVDKKFQREIRKARGNRFFVKYPIKHFHADEFDYKEEMKTGIFYDISNTHMVDFRVFVHCMSIQELGILAFYIYSFLANKNQLHKKGYDISLEKLSEESGIPYRTTIRYLAMLRSYNLIDVIHNQDYYVVGLGNDRKSNTYITNNPSNFTFQPIFYKKIDVKTLDEYTKIINGEYENSYKQSIAFGTLL